MVIDDEMNSAQFVSVREGELKAGEIVLLSRKKFDGDSLELDGEGVAYADGSFYVIGSHGHPRDKDHKLDADEIAARIAASSQVVRIRLKPGSGEELGENDVLDVEASSKLFAGVFRWRKRGSAAPDPCARAGYSSGRIDQPAVLP